MYQQTLNHPANLHGQPLTAGVYQAMYQLFEQICLFWGNLDNPEQYQSRLFAFMDNRIRLHPEYKDIYTSAQHTLDELINALGQQAAYQLLFTDQAANQAPPTTPLAMVRQKVSNEFIAFQVSQGGFKAFSGAINYPSFIAGAWVPGQPAPYRTAEEKTK
ncbi:hypothetical protein HNQ59_003786 [Chitinivorax tropicus]|uniref:Uncharacterized protein n=1 Tax=Chitinivorax tropicus TaxID=714531 RepID=A0A840MVW7_9PROT|nr:hypothetical protein [Chitinivorax tropicus]MBB5020466.1 hypothetical protein [Chitinivorax tropicus]